MAKESHITEAATGPSFEETLAELEQLVQELEQGQLGLTESIEKYERGVKLLKQCHDELNRVERKIQLLTQVTEDGHAIVETISDEPSDDPQGSHRAQKRGYSGAEEKSEIDGEGRLF